MGHRQYRVVNQHYSVCLCPSFSTSFSSLSVRSWLSPPQCSTPSLPGAAAALPPQQHSSCSSSSPSVSPSWPVCLRQPLPQSHPHRLHPLPAFSSSSWEDLRWPVKKHC